MPVIHIPPDDTPPVAVIWCQWCGWNHQEPEHCSWCGHRDHVPDAHCRRCGNINCALEHCGYCGRTGHAADDHCPSCRMLGCVNRNNPCNECGWCRCDGPCNDCGNCGCEPCQDCESCGCDGPCRWCGSCSCATDDEDCPSSPYNRPFRIHGYSYRPNPLRFHGSGPLFLGMELELEAGRNINNTLAVVRDSFGDLVYCKEDGSIHNGYEMVTHPMDWAYAAEHFPWHGLAELKAAGASTVEERNGIHVHLSRAGFDGAPHVFSWMKFLHRNRSRVIDIARRDSGQWASWDTETRKLQKFIAKPELAVNRYAWPRDRHGRQQPVYLPTGRYQAINCQNAATFELRVFASSLDQDEVAAALALSSSTVEYTRTLTSNEIWKTDGWSWPAFTSWLDSQPTYAPLRKEIARLCVS